MIIGPVCNIRSDGSRVRKRTKQIGLRAYVIIVDIVDNDIDGHHIVEKRGWGGGFPTRQLQQFPLKFMHYGIIICLVFIATELIRLILIQIRMLDSMIFI